MSKALTAREEFMRLRRMDYRQKMKLAVMLLVAIGDDPYVIQTVGSRLTRECVDEISADAVELMDELRKSNIV